MNKKEISFVYRSLTTISLFTGIYLNLCDTPSIMMMASYYTIQSNAICLGAFVYLLIAQIWHGEDKQSRYYLIKGAITVLILIAAIVYLVSLAPNGFRMGNTMGKKYIADLLVHVISPTFVLMDYFFFDLKGKIKSWYPIVWSFIPLLYLPYVYIYSALGGRFYGIGQSILFAYKFLDYQQIGWIGVLESIAAIVGIGLVISSVILLGSKAARTVEVRQQKRQKKKRRDKKERKE